MTRFRFLARIAAVATIAACVMPGCIGDGNVISYDPTLAIIDARTQLYQAADNSNPAYRSNAIEALAEVEGYKAGGVFKQALDDPKPLVRFAAAMAIGDAKYTPALEKLLKMANPSERLEPDKRVFCAVIYALHQLGNDDYAGELGELMFDEQEEVRADAVLAMGKMGDASAIGPLNTLLTDERKENVKLVIVEALALLGDQKSAAMLETHIRRRFIEDQLIAINAMAESPSSRSPHVLYNTMMRVKEEVIVRCAAAASLAKIGHPEEYGYRLCVNALEHPREIMREKSGENRPITRMDVVRLQQIAALSLGDMERNDAVAVLLPALKLEEPSVRIAAARSILKLLGTPEPEKIQETAESQDTAEPDDEPEETEKTAPPAEDKPKLHRAGGKD